MWTWTFHKRSSIWSSETEKAPLFAPVRVHVGATALWLQRYNLEWLPPSTSTHTWTTFAKQQVRESDRTGPHTQFRRMTSNINCVYYGVHCNYPPQWDIIVLKLSRVPLFQSCYYVTVISTESNRRGKYFSVGLIPLLCVQQATGRQKVNRVR